MDAERIATLAEEFSDNGIAKTFNLWKETQHKTTEERVLYYLKVIQHHILKMERSLSSSLDGVPLVLSGMASSSIGMMELPYGQLPFAVDGSDVEAKMFRQHQQFRHDVLLISGVKSEDDVMRGEETQLIGLLNGQQTTSAEKVYIFPGTHSKHITVRVGQVVAFKTYMTGDFFELLSKKSMLNDSLEVGPQIDLKGFRKGVEGAIGNSLLYSAFRVRTNDLFKKLTKQENANYLSGLLIGTELLHVKDSTTEVCLSCGTNLKALYEEALDVLKVDNVHVFSAEEAEQAVVRGHFKILKHFRGNDD